MDGSVYEYQPSFILGFHGCNKAVGESILTSDGLHLKPSEKSYDWLGSGIYFWEGSVARAWEWAYAKQAEGKIQEPFVVGAIIDLRHCLDLFDRHGMEQLRPAYRTVIESAKQNGDPVPKNVGPTPDKAGRKLDCAVLNMLHTLREGSALPPFDSVRGPFLEGRPIYRGAGFRSHSHIQICVRNQACIKGYFKPITPA
jgi:hypothetical protein